MLILDPTGKRSNIKLAITASKSIPRQICAAEQQEKLYAVSLMPACRSLMSALVVLIHHDAMEHFAALTTASRERRDENATGRRGRLILADIFGRRPASFYSCKTATCAYVSRTREHPASQ